MRNNESPAIVVVNDDITQLNILAGLLRKRGYRVQTYENPVPALDEMKPDAVPDLIVTDIYMPEIDGWRFCRLLRSPEFQHLNKVPIIVVSATYAGEEAQRITADLGAEAFLPSPVDGEQFLNTADAVLQNLKSPSLPRVLVVDDSRSLAGLLQNTLTEYGYHVDIALNISQAREMIKDRSYEIAILDYNLPDGNGDCLLECFRDSNLGTACIMMTANSSPGLAVTWIRAGAAAYLQKPFDLEYLVELCGRTRREHALLRVEKLLEKRTIALAESEEKYRTLVNTSTEGIQLSDLEGRITFSNPAHHRIQGYPENELIGKYIWDMASEESEKARTKEYYKMLIKEQPQPEPFYSLDKTNNGRLIHTQVNWDYIRDSEGKLTGIIGVISDITNSKQAEEAIKNLLQEKEFLLKEVHHRIGNNMCTIIGLLTLQSETLVNNPDAKMALIEAQNRVQSMLVLYNKLFLSSDFQNVSTRQYFETLIEEIIKNFTNKDIVSVMYHIEDVMLGSKLIFDLGIIINELITNTMKHAFVGKESGKIIASLSVGEEHAVMTIQNDGTELPESVSFENPSSGFGFKLVSLLVNQLDGSIEIERGEGTKFIIKFNIET